LVLGRRRNEALLIGDARLLVTSLLPKIGLTYVRSGVARHFVYTPLDLAQEPELVLDEATVKLGGFNATRTELILLIDAPRSVRVLREELKAW